MGNCRKCEQERLRLEASLPDDERIMRIYLVKTPVVKLGFCDSSSARSYATSNQYSRFGDRNVHVRAVNGEWLALQPLPSDIVMAEGQTCFSFN